MATRHVAIGVETTWGNAVASYAFMEALSENVRRIPQNERIQTIRSDVTREIAENASAVSGDIEIIGNYQDMGAIGYWLLGGADTAGTGPYTHTSPASTGLADRPALTVEVERDNATQTWRYNGCVLTGVTFSAQVNQVARVGLSVFGNGEGTGTATTQSFPTLDVMLSKHITPKFDATSLDAVSCNLNIGYPVDEPYVLGSATLGKQPQSNDVLEVTGDVTVLFENMTQYNKFDGSTVVDFQLSCTDGTHSWTVNCNKTRLIQATPVLTGRERLQATYEFESYFDTTATANIQLVTVNDDADPTA